MGAGLTEAAPCALELRGLAKSYGGVVAVAPTDLDVAPGEFLTLLGPSGSGKTTLLSMVAGLTEPSAGQIRLAGRDVTRWPSWRRGLGVVFQSYALFPHMTVAENIAFPLRMRRTPRGEMRQAVDRALAQVRLTGLADRLPRALSGGQQQRVAVARAIVFGPSVVLMDEPLGALDRRLRDELKEEIRRLHRELSATIIYVTHDQDEAMALSDRICLMDRARVAQIGTPAALYRRPASRFVAEFVGRSNILAARPLADGRMEVEGVILQSSCPVPDGAMVLLRPERLALGDGPNAMRGTVREVLDLGGTRELLVQVTGGPLLRVTTLSRSSDLSPEVQVTLSIAPEDVVPLRPEPR